MSQTENDNVQVEPHQDSMRSTGPHTSEKEHLKSESSVDLTDEDVENDQAAEVPKKSRFSEPTSKSEDLITPRYGMLILYALITVGLSVLHLGWAFMGNTQVAPVLIAKFGWNEDETRLYNSLIGNSSLLGLMIGSLFGGVLVTRGRRLTIMLMNSLIFIGASLTLVETLPTILVGRFVKGLAASVFQMASLKSLFETVPQKYYGVFASLTNIFLNFSGVFVIVLGMGVPTNKEDYVEDQMWRLSYAAPIVLSILQLTMLLTLFKYEPIDFSIQRDKDEQALKFIQLVLKPAKGQTGTQEEVLSSYLTLRRQELKAAESSSKAISFKDAVSSPDYAASTWVCCGVAVCNQVTAIGPVSIFSSTLLMKIQTVTDGEFPISIKDGILILTFVGFVGAMLGTLAVKYIGRKKIFIAGHTLMTLCHALIGIFYLVEQYVVLYVFILFFIFSFQVSSGCITFIYLAEVCVDAGMGVVQVCMFLTNVIMAFSISFLIDSAIGVSGTFWIYAGLNLLATIFCVIFVQETRGKSPLELKRSYSRSYSKASQVQAEPRAEAEMATKKDQNLPPDVQQPVPAIQIQVQVSS